jgi:hypothetical protein
MKKIYLSCSLLFVGFLSQAQINKGAILLGGNLYYNELSQSSNPANQPPSKSTNLTFSPSFGKAIKDDLVLGFDITYGHSTTSQPQVYSQTSDAAGADFFIRKYKLLGNGFYLFGQAGIGGNFSHNSANDPGTPTSVTTSGNGYNISLQIFPGIAYAINRNWQVELALPNFFGVNYNHDKGTTSTTGQPDQSSTNSTFNAVSSLTGTNEFSVGLRYVIDRPRAHSQQSSSQSATSSR